MTLPPPTAGSSSTTEAGTLPRIRFDDYDRDLLLSRNFIDLNAFVHRRRLYDQLGGFDESLKRLVDWDLVLRYTRRYPPTAVPLALVNYFGGEDESRVTQVEDFAQNAKRVRARVAYERSYTGHAPLRLGYVLWDYPALSQTFVLNEIRQLADDGYDVNVYYYADPDRGVAVDFSVPTYRVEDADALAALVQEHSRTMLHSHFAYPAATLHAWPAAQAAGLPFTFTVHAVDVFHEKNRERNRIDEMAADPLCARVFAIGEFHRRFLIERGAPPEKISIVRPAATHRRASAETVELRLSRKGTVVAAVSRFVEKKGLSDLIRASSILGEDVEIRLYGYGPEEEALRELALELGAGGVSFEGALEGPEALAKALDSADVFALPCIKDSNGDMDGLPTVLGEAMAAGLPVITTHLSAIPEVVRDGMTGFTVPPNNPEALASRIVEVLGMDRDELRAVVHAAQDAAKETWSVKRTVAGLLEVWEEPPVDIVMVTHSRDEPGGAETTLEIVRRIYELTASHFVLTIVDNDSDPGYRAALEQAVAGKENAALILLDENVHWGPAMNIALASRCGEFAIYVCSKEGFALRPAWERAFLDHLRANRDTALAGHRISSPAFPTGRDYAGQPWFKRFRHKEFAVENPDREFSHVQGGLFGLRIAAYERCGEFSTVVTQEAVDIEYSYLVESLGWKLGSVRSVPSITKKTRPRINAHIDEHTVAAHPLTLESVQKPAEVASGKAAFCNVCAWTGPSFDSAESFTERCPECGSTPFGRLVFRWVAGTALPYRRLRCAALLDDETVARELEPMFDLSRIRGDSLGNGDGSADLVIADLASVPSSSHADLLGFIATSIASKDGTAAVGISKQNGASRDLGDVARALEHAGLAAEELVLESDAVRFAPHGLVVARGQANSERVVAAR